MVRTKRSWSLACFSDNLLCKQWVCVCVCMWCVVSFYCPHVLYTENTYIFRISDAVCASWLASFAIRFSFFFSYHFWSHRKRTWMMQKRTPQTVNSKSLKCYFKMHITFAHLEVVFFFNFHVFETISSLSIGINWPNGKIIPSVFIATNMADFVFFSLYFNNIWGVCVCMYKM